jgi:CBS domain-containing protein
MNVGQVCSRNLVSAASSASLADLAKLMHDRHVGAVVITKAPLDRPVAIGIVTDRDIVRAQLERKSELARLAAEDIMTRDPLVVAEGDAIDDAIQRMRARGVRRAPVVTAHGALAGMVSTDDLVAEIARELGNLARILERQRAPVDYT